MPFFVELNVAGGPQSFAYNISTPTSAHAESIDPKLPTVLFLHPVFIGQEAFVCELLMTHHPVSAFNCFQKPNLMTPDYANSTWLL